MDKEEAESLWPWAQFLLALGFVRVLGLSERARFTLAAYHRPLGFGITVAGLTTVLVRPAKPGWPGLACLVTAAGLLVRLLRRAAPPRCCCRCTSQTVFEWHLLTP